MYRNQCYQLYILPFLHHFICFFSSYMQWTKGILEVSSSIIRAFFLMKQTPQSCKSYSIKLPISFVLFSSKLYHFGGYLHGKNVLIFPRSALFLNEIPYAEDFIVFNFFFFFFFFFFYSTILVMILLYFIFDRWFSNKKFPTNPYYNVTLRQKLYIVSNNSEFYNLLFKIND